MSVQNTEDTATSKLPAGDTEKDLKTGPDTSKQMSVETLQSELEVLKAALKKTEDEKFSFIRKLEKLEKQDAEKEKAALAEQGKFKELYEAAQAEAAALRSKMKDGLITSTLKDQIVEAGGQSVETIMKLIDKSKIIVSEDDKVDIASITAELESLKKSDPILFGVKKTPDVKRPSEGEVKGTFTQRLEATKSLGDLKKLMQTMNA